MVSSGTEYAWSERVRFGLAFLLLLLLVGTACSSSGGRGLAAGDDVGQGGESAEPSAPDDNGAGPASPADNACAVDSDCEAVASSCCECPTFAVPISSGFGSVCEDVSCGAPPECPAQQAVCSPSGSCELICSPVVCELSCENGFVLDAAGCATCECAIEPIVPECAVAEDCVQVAADCCGCERGGNDTAVAADEAADFVAALGCTGSEICPDIDACEAESTAECRFGSCVLTTPSQLDESEQIAVCGSAESPTCADGADCVLNPRDYPELAAAGLGVCL